MIEKFCLFLTNQIRKKDSTIDNERAEAINYGLQLIVGEVPKMLITLAIAYIFGIFKLTLITVLVLLPYRGFSGGFHLKTHIGCIISTTLIYCGIPEISKYIYLNSQTKIIFVLCVLILGIIMIKKYAPADTEFVPILRKKERKQKQILSYISFILGLIIALAINNNVISNIIIISYLVQTIMITPFAYKLARVKYGYEVYNKQTSETLT